LWGKNGGIIQPRIGCGMFKIITLIVD